MQNKIMIIIAYIFPLLFSLNSFAKLQIGEIIRRSGPNVTINDKLVKASVPLFWGDRLISGPDTILEILIYPSMALKLQPSTEVKLVGNLVQEIQKNITSTSAIQLVKGQITGYLAKNANIENKVKVFARKTVSAIRGTTFEISEEENVDSIEVFEGVIEVSSIADEEKVNSVSLSAGNEITTIDLKPQVVAQKEVPIVLKSEEIDTVWNKNSEMILSSHAKEAKKYKELLDRDVRSVYKGLQKDAKGMFKSTKGAYDQFKKKK